MLASITGPVTFSHLLLSALGNAPTSLGGIQHAIKRAEGHIGACSFLDAAVFGKDAYRVHAVGPEHFLLSEYSLGASVPTASAIQKTVSSYTSTDCFKTPTNEFFILVEGDAMTAVWPPALTAAVRAAHATTPPRGVPWMGMSKEVSEAEDTDSAPEEA